MIAHFLEEEQLDKDDVRRLRNMLEKNRPRPAEERREE